MSLRLRRPRGQTALAALCTAALALFGVTAVGAAAGNTAATSARAPAAKTAATTTAAVAPTSTAPAWTGTFDDFHSAGWISQWGTTSDTAQCEGASGTFTCNWGYPDLKPVSDSTAPGSGQALQVTYPADSGPPSCYLTVTGCVLGGGQFYQDLTTNGESALAQSPSLDLKYDYEFPVGFDFGGKQQGKMPGLWGGGVMGCESGAQHCAQGWSTRYMWKGGSATAPNGELYFYTASGEGYGADLCNGNWKFAADGRWHSIEQLTNVQTGSITIWSDGVNVCQVTEPMPGAHSGIFFSTFHGGHDLSYSPKTTVTSEFADFSLSTDGPQSTGGPTAPATPTGLTATGTSGSTIALSWSEAGNGDPAVSYKVYEGRTQVGASTTTSATISGLTPGSTHTYTVDAVDAAGVASGQSAAATATTPNPSTAPATPTGLTVSGTTSTSVSLSWSEANNADPAASYNVLEGGAVVGSSAAKSATIGGLAPGSTHTYTVEAVDAAGTASAQSAPTTATTPNPTTTPAAPSHLTVASATSSSLSLTWLETDNGDPAASYRVYEGSTVVGTATSSGATITGLVAGSTHTYTVTAVDAAHNESAHSAPATGSTSGGGGGGLTVSLVKTKDWGSGFADTATITNTSKTAVSGWNLQFDLPSTEAVYASSGVSYSASANHYTLTPYPHDSTIAAGASLQIGFDAHYSGAFVAPTNVVVYPIGTTLSPAVPTGLKVTGVTNTSISLAWTETNNTDPAVSYQVSEGAVAVATVTAPSVTISGLTSGSAHTYTVEAIDASGDGSGAGAPVTGTTSGGGGGGGSQFSQPLIDSAVAAPLFAWAAPTSAVPRPGTNPALIGEAKVLYYLALVDRQHPGARATNGTTVDSALLAQVRSLIAGGNEPDADGGLEMWGQAPVAQALLLLRNDSAAWKQLTSAEQNKVSLLEAAMGYGSNYTYNDANSFGSGICGFGNFSKTSNPNYRDGGVDTEIAAIQYFGAAAWDGMLAEFNDATVASQLDAAGLTNAGGCFTTLGSAGNAAIAIPFAYQGHHSSDLMGIWSTIAGNTFDLTAQSTVSPAHIADGTTSPYDGQCCMAHEFDSTDSSGLRSSALYSYEGWMNVTGSRVAMEVLGNFNPAAAATEAQYHVGTLDLKYKLDHGYVGYALNQAGILVDDRGDPAADGPNVKGFLYDWDAYSVSGAPQS